jgi:hypothetical protein
MSTRNGGRGFEFGELKKKPGLDIYGEIDG